jgi:hypothetical protein
MLNKFEMEDCKPVSTPMVIGCKLSKEDESKDANQTLYKLVIGILLYVIASRPDIMNIVGLVGRFQDAPKETHVQVIKIIFRYLEVILKFGLWHPTGKYFSLTAYTNAYWVGSVDNRNITSGGAFFLGNSLVSWFSKKKSSISLSSTEAKYIAETTCCTQFHWLKQMLKDIYIYYSYPISILCGNTSAINISNNIVIHSKTKNTPFKYNFSREQVT